jgi:hypothetical protein
MFVPFSCRGPVWLVHQTSSHPFYDASVSLDAFPEILIHSLYNSVCLRKNGRVSLYESQSIVHFLAGVPVPEQQNLSNHARFFPPFHFFAAPILLANFIWSIFRVKHDNFSAYSIFQVFVAAALVVTLAVARLMALKVQDRVIRLEEHLRYQRLLPPDLLAHIGDFTVNQFVSLRFASDAELPALARKVLDEKMNDRKAIKQLIKVWRPDTLRA